MPIQAPFKLVDGHTGKEIINPISMEFKDS